MLDQIQEVVRKNLPAEIGEQLKRHLSEAEGWKRERDSAKTELESAKASILQHMGNVQKLEEALKLAGDLDKREKVCRDRENRLDVTLANLKAAEAERRADAVTALAGQVFRNPRLVVNRTGNVPNPAPGSYGTVGVNESESREVE